jgi:lysophospholipase L1-like esterase
MQRCILLLLSLVTLAKLHSAEPSGFYLKDGDRVVFYGDSITDQRLYTTFTETYVVTRFPKMNVTFTHSGWGGDRVTGGGGGPIDTRLKRDVFAYHPTVMTIMLGMNDAAYKAFDQKIFDVYAKGYEHIIASLHDNLPGLRLTLIQPSPFDDVTREPKFEGGYNKVLVRYGEFVKELAAKNGATVADLNTAVVRATEKANARDTNGAIAFNPDRVHPGAAGQLLMANELLKAWKAPALVSDVQIDARGKKVVRSEGAEISALQSGASVTWTQLDRALPMPISTNDSVMALAVSCSDVLESLDHEVLKVTGLDAGRYSLHIDGSKAVGTFTQEQLNEGLNLALLPTPMSKQAAKVHDLTLKHNNVHFERWRMIQVPMAEHKNAKIDAVVPTITAALDEEEAELVKQQREAAQPKPHQFELAPEK